MVSWIQTFSGKAIDPIDPNPLALDIIDVAHALSHVNRYTGHTFKPYSVGLHSLTGPLTTRAAFLMLFDALGGVR